MTWFLNAAVVSMFTIASRSEFYSVSDGAREERLPNAVFFDAWAFEGLGCTVRIWEGSAIQLYTQS